MLMGSPAVDPYHQDWFEILAGICGSLGNKLFGHFFFFFFFFFFFLGGGGGGGGLLTLPPVKSLMAIILGCCFFNFGCTGT